jgi:hypothetical protein
MDADEPKRFRRRWHSHERHVLVVIALIAAVPFGWLAWQANIVRHRRAMRDQIEANGGADWEWEEGFTPIIRYPVAWDSFSEIRRLLGDKEIWGIEFSRQLTPSDGEAIEAFPEATVVGIPGSPPSPTRPLVPISRAR